MPPAPPIRCWNRAREREEEEPICGERALRWLYETRAGRLLAESLLSRRVPSRIFGWLQSTRWSRRWIPSFTERFGIDPSEFEDEDYRSFNDFFTRRFKEGARSFCSGDELPAFAEGRYLAFESVPGDAELPVKDLRLSLGGLLGRAEEEVPFRCGPALIARLAPIDYHRFHYPDDGTTERAYRVGGRLHSVHPIALRLRGDILATNERRVSILRTERFGRLAYVEVGAMNVGRIVATHPAEEPYVRGGEKGYFLFGGSSVVVLGEPGRWRVDDDLLARSREGQETLVRLGKRVARASG